MGKYAVIYIQNNHTKTTQMRKPETVRLEMHKRRAEDEEGYLYFIVKVKGQKSVPKSTGYKIPAKYWDVKTQTVLKGCPDAPRINLDLSNQKTKLTTELYNEKIAGKELSEKLIKEKLTPVKEGKDLVSFFRQIVAYHSTERKTQKAEKSKWSANNLRKWNTELDRLENYQSSINFKSIDVQWLEDYEAHCAKTLDKDTSLPITMSRLMQILNKASKKGYFEISAIADYKLPTYKNPPRNYLTLKQTDDIAKKLYEGAFDDSLLEKSVTAYFLLECWAGLRFSDWSKYKIEQLIHNKALKVGETKKTGQPIYIPLNKSPRLATLVEFIQSEGLLMTYAEQTVNKTLKIIGRIMKIPFNLTTHVGRHTCATLLLELGYSKEAVAEWLGISLKVVDIYAKNTRQKLRNEYAKYGGL